MAAGWAMASIGDFMNYYRKEGVVAERPHLNLPANTYEEEIGLDGFFGHVSHLYHCHPPTSWSGIERSSFQWPQLMDATELFLKPQCFKPLAVAASAGDFFTSKKTIFWNSDIEISLRKIDRDSPVYFRNADAHDLFFCHEGSFVCESPFGEIHVKAGDYLVIPKGVTYRFQKAKAYVLGIESLSTPFKKPETGILGQQAFYHEEQLRCPQFKPCQSDGKSIVRVQRDRVLTDILYEFDLRNLSGWCGTLFPYALSVKSIAPVLSSMAHLPPSVNATFVTNAFIVCTFLPRPLEEPEGALKVPFYHSNIDYDEVIFYHEGDFFSRDHMEKGSITLHPRGINHGPHPKALMNQNSKKRTDEIAVMVDTVRSLRVSGEAKNLELSDYWKSWTKKA